MNGEGGNRGSREAGGGGGRTHLLLAFIISSLTSFRDGASFLLLIETPPTFRSSISGFGGLRCERGTYIPGVEYARWVWKQWARGGAALGWNVGGSIQIYTRTDFISLVVMRFIVWAVSVRS